MGGRDDDEPTPDYRVGPGRPSDPSDRSKTLSEEQQAYLRGELDHEWMDPNEPYEEGIPSIAQWAEDWKVDHKEARRRITNFKVQRHRDNNLGRR